MRFEKRGGPSEDPETPRKEEKKRESGTKRDVSALIYTTVLFVVALVLILLSYHIQHRANNTISDMTEQHGQVTAQALRNIEELQKMNQTLNGELDEIRDELEEAKALNEELSGRLEQAGEENRSLEVRITELTIQAEELAKRAEAAGTLMRLTASRDPEEQAELLTAMASLSQYLDEAGHEIYNSFIENMNAVGE